MSQKNFTLGQLVSDYKPQKRVTNNKRYTLFTPPTFSDLKKMGKLDSGEIALLKKAGHKKLEVIYGTKNYVCTLEESLLHNHGSALPFPSWYDAHSAYGPTEYISNKDGISQIRYFRKKKTKGKASVVDLLTLDEISCESAVDERSYSSPVHLKNVLLPSKNGKRLPGFYEAIFIPWKIFNDLYDSEKFWFVFDRRRSWVKLFSGRKLIK